MPLLEGQAYTAKPAALTEHHGWKNLRTARFRYLVHADGRERLWNLEDDPHEYHDIAAESAYREVLAEHRKLLLEKLLSLERPLGRTWPY